MKTLYAREINGGLKIKCRSRKACKFAFQLQIYIVPDKLKTVSSMGIETILPVYIFSVFVGVT